MSKANDPAFPIHPGEFLDIQGVPRWHRGQAGLTKREYFAAMAMQGLLANEFIMNDIKEGRITAAGNQLAGVQVLAVLTADALIAELENP